MTPDSCALCQPCVAPVADSSPIRNAENIMSRTHCLLFLLYMIDASLNGTFVNDFRYRKRTRNRLHDGDTLSFDDCQETSVQITYFDCVGCNPIVRGRVFVASDESS